MMVTRCSGIVGNVAVIAGILCVSMATTAPRAGGQQAAVDACAPVQAAYQKTTNASNSSKATNTGGLNLRDETLQSEDTNVYSDVFASKSGIAKATVWVSKKNGWVLKREVDVEIMGVGKGHQAIVFEYPSK